MADVFTYDYDQSVYDNREAFKVFFGLLFRQLRKEHGFSSEEIGKLVDVSDTTITRIESGNSEMTAYTWYRLCQIYGLSLTDVLEQWEAVKTTPDLLRMVFLLKNLTNEEMKTLLTLLKSYLEKTRNTADPQ